MFGDQNCFFFCNGLDHASLVVSSFYFGASSPCWIHLFQGAMDETSSILADGLQVCAEVSRGFHHDIKIFEWKYYSRPSPAA